MIWKLKYFNYWDAENIVYCTCYIFGLISKGIFILYILWEKNHQFNKTYVIKNE